jgi:hypothetical protein
VTDDAVDFPPGARNDEENDELETAIRDAMPVVVRFFESDPLAYTRIEALLERHLRIPVDVDTQGAIFDGLTLYAGAEFAQALLTLLARASRDADQFADATNKMPDDVASALRTLGGFYGAPLRKANDFAWEDPEDWWRVTREPVWELSNEAWRFNVTVYKYSGEEFRLGLRAGAMITLVEALLSTLLLSPDDQVDHVEAWRVQGLATVYEQVRQRHGGEDAAPDEEARADPIAGE